MTIPPSFRFGSRSIPHWGNAGSPKSRAMIGDNFCTGDNPRAGNLSGFALVSSCAENQVMLRRRLDHHLSESGLATAIGDRIERATTRGVDIQSSSAL